MSVLNKTISKFKKIALLQSHCVHDFLIPSFRGQDCNLSAKSCSHFSHRCVLQMAILAFWHILRLSFLLRLSRIVDRCQSERTREAFRSLISAGLRHLHFERASQRADEHSASQQVSRCTRRARD